MPQLDRILSEYESALEELERIHSNEYPPTQHVEYRSLVDIQLKHMAEKSALLAGMILVVADIVSEKS